MLKVEEKSTLHAKTTRAKQGSCQNSRRTQIRRLAEERQMKRTGKERWVVPLWYPRTAIKLPKRREGKIWENKRNLYFFLLSFALIK